MKMLLTTSVLVVACLFLGCTSSQTTANKKNSSENNAIKVVYIPKNTGNPYFNSIISGFEKAAGDFDFEFTVVAPASAEATSQLPFINDQIQRGVDVLAISPNSPDALNAVFDRARKQGVIVMVVNSDIPGNESHRDIAIMPMDFGQVGTKNIEIISELIGGQGDIAIVSATTDAPDQNFWIDGMKKVLQEERFQGLKLVDIVYGDDDPQKSTVEAEGLIAKHPDLQGVISPTSVGIAATAQVIELAGVYPGGPNAKGPGLKLTGMGTPNQMRRFVKSDIVEKYFLWDPALVGYIGGFLATEMTKGEIEPEPGKSFEVPNLGTREFQNNNVVIAGPAVVFEKANIDEWHF